MLDTIKLWFFLNRDALLFSLYGALMTLIAWTCGFITRTIIETIVKDDCDC